MSLLGGGHTALKFVGQFLDLVAVFLVVALAGLAAFLPAIIVLAVGLIFALSGVTLLYKRTENLLAVVQFAFVGFIAAPVEAYPVLKLFPLALGSDLLRQVMNTSARLWEVPPADLALLAGTVIGYLALGYVGFRNSMQKARDRGVLGHY